MSVGQRGKAGASSDPPKLSLLLIWGLVGREYTSQTCTGAIDRPHWVEQSVPEPGQRLASHYPSPLLVIVILLQESCKTSLRNIQHCILEFISKCLGAWDIAVSTNKYDFHLGFKRQKQAVPRGCCAPTLLSKNKMSADKWPHILQYSVCS